MLFGMVVKPHAIQKAKKRMSMQRPDRTTILLLFLVLFIMDIAVEMMLPIRNATSGNQSHGAGSRPKYISVMNDKVPMRVFEHANSKELSKKYFTIDMLKKVLAVAITPRVSSSSSSFFC